jgi:uncharacterized protein YggE
MVMLLVLLLIAQTGASVYENTPSITFDRPILSVSCQGKASIAVQATEYRLILYADSHAEDTNEARKSADLIREKIIQATKELGGKADDVVITNLNVLPPIAGDQYYRVEQDIQIWFKGITDINKAKEKFLLIEGIQIGSLTPIISEASEYTPAIAKARKDAVKNAREEAQALAAEIGVSLGEPFYVHENIEYPTYAGYEASGESEIIVSVTIYYQMIYKK